MTTPQISLTSGRSWGQAPASPQSPVNEPASSEISKLYQVKRRQGQPKTYLRGCDAVEIISFDFEFEEGLRVVKWWLPKL